MDIDGALSIQTAAPPTGSLVNGGGSSQHIQQSNSSLSSPKNKVGPSRWRPTSGHFSIKTGASRYSGSFDNLASPTTPRDLGANLNALRRAQSVKDVGPNDPPIRGSSGNVGGGSVHDIAPTSPVDFPALIAQGSNEVGPNHGSNTVSMSSLHGIPSDAHYQGQTHPAVVRSRSSYSFQTMNNVLTVPNLMRNLRKQSMAASAAAVSGPPHQRKASAGPGEMASSSSGIISLAGASAGGAAATAASLSVAPPKHEGFLTDIGANTFSGIWNHPITRCYFLMFLIWREYENLYFFRLDAQQFRLDYPTLYPSARKSQAYRLYNTYLVKNAPMFILRRVPAGYQNARAIITKIKATMDSHDATLFDDLSFLVLNWLKDLYNGTFETHIDAARDPDEPLPPPPRSAAFPDAMSVGNGNGNGNGGVVQSFPSSAMYQAMRNDLRGTRHLTTIQYNRVAERITDMPPAIYDGNDMWDKLMVCLENMGLDCETFRARAAGASIVRRPSQKDPKATVSSRTRSFSSINENRRSNAPSDTPDDGSAPALKDWRKSSSNHLNTAYGKNDFAHTFVQYTSTDQHYCEYCFKALRSGNEGPINTYRCESCGYMCHKHCRKEIRVLCLQPSTTLEVDDQTEVLSDKTQRITEKMQAIQREVDIEMKIRDGLNNLVRAKSELGTKSKKVVPVEVDSQMERSGKKLDLLKHELQKCRLQLAALSAAAAAAATAALRDSALDGSSPVGGHQRMSSHASAMLQDVDRDGDVVKIVTMDSAQKAESTKSFYVTNETTVKQLITIALEKFVMPGSGEDYLLSYRSSEGEHVPLRPEDYPYRLGLNLIDTSFLLKVNFGTGSVRYDPSLKKSGASMSGLGLEKSASSSSLLKHGKHVSKEDEIRQRKQREVLMEIAETEINYTEDLRNVISLFYLPLTLAAVLNSESETSIFANMKDILAIHDGLASALKELHDHIMSTREAVLPEILSLFARRVDALRAYEVYCGNQHHARRTLERLRVDPTFAKVLAQCETNPRLQKLNLADLLVKPMHRVTRYPILFKRLLSYVAKSSPEYDTVNNLINDIEARVADINESVRKHEAEYRIHVIEESLDFNNVTERFKLANGRRELISEKTLTYLKKNTNGTVELSAVFFTDMILLIRPKKAGETYILFKPPIPLEAAVFLDKPDAFGLKNVFLIIHLQQEIHTLQAISAYDKNTWLQQSEAIRSQFCSLHYHYEHTILKDSSAKYHAHKHSQTQLDTSAQSSPTISEPPQNLPRGKTIHSSSPSAKRRYTSSTHSSLRNEKLNDTYVSGDSDEMLGPPLEGETPPSSVNSIASASASIKRTGSWAHMFKSHGALGVRYKAATSHHSGPLLPEHQQSQQMPLPALPVRSGSEQFQPGQLQDHVPTRRGSNLSFSMDHSPSGASLVQHRSRTSLASGKSSMVGGWNRQPSRSSMSDSVSMASSHSNSNSNTNTNTVGGVTGAAAIFSDPPVPPPRKQSSTRKMRKEIKQKNKKAKARIGVSADAFESPISIDMMEPPPPLPISSSLCSNSSSISSSLPNSPLDISSLTHNPANRSATHPETNNNHHHHQHHQQVSPPPTTTTTIPVTPTAATTPQRRNGGGTGSVRGSSSGSGGAAEKRTSWGGQGGGGKHWWTSWSSKSGKHGVPSQPPLPPPPSLPDSGTE
ncbi:hypothetical protein HKX48_008982 [Thoreauomyces humboldtii]|nr:hypothetical protein HKX48_008982 [Thoreauomyces humboldtii]